MTGQQKPEPDPAYLPPSDPAPGGPPRDAQPPGDLLPPSGDPVDPPPNLPPPSGPPVVPAPPPSGTPVAQPPHGQPQQGMASMPAPAGAPHQLPPPPGVSRLGEWHQLDPKMLLVTPVRTLLSLALPLLIAIFGVGQGNPRFAIIIGVIGAAVALVFGIIPWFTTRYRFTETQLQVRRGLLNRNVVTAPLDRIRSVDLESTLLHRMLSLAKVQIGTGVDDTRIELDALARPAATELRTYLLKRSDEVDTPAEVQDAEADASDGAAPVRQVPRGVEVDVQLAAINWGWLRFAPFSLSSLAIVAALLGVIWPFLEGSNLQIDRVEQTWSWFTTQSIAVMVGAGAVILLVGWVLLSTLNYVLNWWNLTLVRQPGGTLKLTRGLLTTRSTTVEEARVRGVRLTEPLLLRSVNGAELATLATGVGTGGTTKVLPPCPRSVAQSVGATVLQERGSLTARLRQHGPAARRRQFIQAQWTTVLVTVPLAVLTWWLEWEWWIPVAVGVGLAAFGVLIGWLTYRNLGHYLTPEHLVAGDGALQRERISLERRGIIGWVVQQSFFQRRRGLATLVATTAAGPERVAIRDVPVHEAIAVAHAATPEVLQNFLDSDTGATRVPARSGWGDLDL